MKRWLSEPGSDDARRPHALDAGAGRPRAGCPSASASSACAWCCATARRCATWCWPTPSIAGSAHVAGVAHPRRRPPPSVWYVAGTSTTSLAFCARMEREMRALDDTAPWRNDRQRRQEHSSDAAALSAGRHQRRRKPGGCASINGHAHDALKARAERHPPRVRRARILAVVPPRGVPVPKSDGRGPRLRRPRRLAQSGAGGLDDISRRRVATRDASKSSRPDRHRRCASPSCPALWRGRVPHPRPPPTLSRVDAVIER